MEFFSQETRLTLTYTTTKIQSSLLFQRSMAQWIWLTATMALKTIQLAFAQKHLCCLHGLPLSIFWKNNGRFFFQKQINKVKQQHSPDRSLYHRFNLGHYTYYKLSQPNCDLCEQPYTTTPLNIDSATHMGQETWQRLGPRNLSNHFSSYIANPSTYYWTIPALSYFHMRSPPLEIHWRYEYHRNTLDESSFVIWARGSNTSLLPHSPFLTA